MIHTTLYFVRHGQTDANVAAARSNEAHDSNMPLNRVGARQAAAVARELEKLTPAAIITSPLLRARQTAGQIAMYHPTVPLIEMADLAERSIGTVANRSWHRLFDVDENIQPEGGESVRDFLTRLYRAYCSIATDYAGQTVIVVAHGGGHHALYASMPMIYRGAAICAVSCLIMARRGGIQFGRILRQRVVSYKSTEHLITGCVLTIVLVRLPDYVLYPLRRIVASRQGD